MPQMTLDGKPRIITIKIVEQDAEKTSYEYCDECEEVTVHKDGVCIDCHILEMEL